MAGPIKLANGHDLKLIASDMDGTILQSDQTIEKKTKELLIHLQEQGVKLVLISGRSIGGMIEYARELEFERFGGVIIGANGAHAYSLADDKELWYHNMPAKYAAHFFKSWEAFGLDHIAYSKNILYLDSPRREFEISEEEESLIQSLSRVTGMEVKIKDLSKPLEEDPCKVCIYGPRDKILEGINIVGPLVEERLYGAFSADNYYESMLRGVNKGTGLQEYADMYNIMPEEIIAFGDQDNDIPMFAYAGTGVAMKRASEGLVAQATYRTGSHNQGGIFEFLNKLLQNQQ